MFLSALLSPTSLSAGDPDGTTITYPAESQVVAFSEVDVGQVLTVQWTGDVPPSYVLSGADASKFTMVGDQLRWVTAPSYASPTDANADNDYAVTLTGDNGYGSDSVSFVVRVTGVAELAPGITYPVAGQVFDYAEDDTAAVLTVSAYGTPAPNLSVSGDDAAFFAVVNGELVWSDSPDYDARQDADGDNVYSVAIVANNGRGTFSVQVFVRLTNVVDITPVITFPSDAPVQVPSGRPAAFTGRSADDASSRTWAITGGADAALFSVVASTGRVSFLAAPDFAAPADADEDNDYELTISVTTTAGSDTQAVTVRVVEATEEKGVARPVIRSIQSSIRG